MAVNLAWKSLGTHSSKQLYQEEKGGNNIPFLSSPPFSPTPKNIPSFGQLKRVTLFREKKEKERAIPEFQVEIRFLSLTRSSSAFIGR